MSGYNGTERPNGLVMVEQRGHLRRLFLSIMFWYFLLICSMGGNFAGLERNNTTYLCSTDRYHLPSYSVFMQFHGLWAHACLAWSGQDLSWIYESQGCEDICRCVGWEWEGVHATFVWKHLCVFCQIWPSENYCTPFGSLFSPLGTFHSYNFKIQYKLCNKKQRWNGLVMQEQRGQMDWL